MILSKCSRYSVLQKKMPPKFNNLEKQFILIINLLFCQGSAKKLICFMQHQLVWLHWGLKYLTTFQVDYLPDWQIVLAVSLELSQSCGSRA